ncbi:helix-turn-helix transcriptional regulator [Paenalkalicoccus suaedae]|uniref:Helix-turn-helix transcriptional regulator n=1 Tax=Paenalkalicoccus suaedae TaxID=2592382 RepID=A0A859FEA4_9BACI|nr:helix-turn-helix transcriptional regulator [Paenalkalicoccus suaedae]
MKYNRIKQRKKQDEVSHGICSVSYYSKIENNKINPADDVIDQLLQRLNLSRSDIDNLDYGEMKEKLHKWHYAIMSDNIRDAEKQKLEIRDELDFFQSQDLRILFLLFSSRLAILTDNGRSAKNNFLEARELLQKDSSQEVEFYYNKISVCYYMYLEDYQQAREQACTAIELTESLVLPDYELSDLLMKAAISTLETGAYTLAIDFATKALKSYDRSYRLENSGRCRVILANAYCQLKNYERASLELDLAESIASQIKSQKLKAQVLQMKGDLSSKQGAKMDAIQFYQLSYRLRTGRARLVTIESILKEFELMDAAQDILSWVEHGKETLEKLQSTRELINYEKKYEKIFLFYETYYGGYDTAKTVDVILNEILPFFISISHWTTVSHYYQVMANVVESSGNLEEAITYYKESIRYLDYYIN